ELHASRSSTRVSSRPSAPCTAYAARARPPPTSLRTTYLPRAHILELCMLFFGMPAGFGRIADGRECAMEFRPSIVRGVPAVWETVRKGIGGKVQAGGAIRSSVFKGAVEAKKRGKPGLARLADSVILSGVTAATGGRLRSSSATSPRRDTSPADDRERARRRSGGRVAALVQRECIAVGKKSGSKATETLTAVVLTPDEWTPESGLVTAAQKIQRSATG
ncbi:hypothetical protein C8F04DRAFT_1330287, partial [Mycena alexandri]